MERLAEFGDIIRRNEPLAPFTHLRIGGPAEMLVQPRSPEELSRLVKRCGEEGIPLRVLGSGCNMLVRDEGVSGAVLRLSEPAFTAVRVEGDRVRAGTGAAVSDLIATAARHGLAGLESLVGIPGTVGGALRTNAGDRAGDIGQFVRQVEVLDDRGEKQVRERLELRFDDHASNLDDPVLLSAEFALEPGQPDAIVKRMRRAWISRKAAQPAVSQAAGRIFKNPRGYKRLGTARPGRPRQDQGRRGGGQRPRPQLHPRACRGDQPRRAGAGRPDARPRPGALQRAARIGDRRVVSKPPPTLLSRLRPWLLQLALPLAVAAALLAGVLWMGAMARAWLAGPPEEPPARVRLRSLDCPAPPGLSRQEFLNEVLFLADLPDEASPDDTAKVRAALQAHPWVREVRSLEMGETPRAEVYFRVPVLFVHPWERVVDRDGILLPKVADTARLFATRATLARPAGHPGQQCGDKDVAAAAAVAGVLLRRRDRLGLAGATVDMADGLATISAKGITIRWGHPPRAESPGEPTATAKVERLLGAAPLAGKTWDVRRSPVAGQGISFPSRMRFSRSR